MSLEGRVFDWTKRIARRFEDPEAHHAGSASPHYQVSEEVTTSQQDGSYVYHVPDNHLGQGASFGNRAVWAETKGNCDMLRMFSVAAGKTVFGGMSISYLMPFSDLSVLGQVTRDVDEAAKDRLTPTLAYAHGRIHLHPAYQQREWVIGDGLRVLQTFFVPQLGGDDPAACCMTVVLHNDTEHPMRLSLVGCLDFRGRTERDIAAEYDSTIGGLLAWNQSAPKLVRYFAGSHRPNHYLATVDEEQAYSPFRSLPNRTEETGDLVGALQYDVTLLPHRHKKVRLFAGFDTKGREAARQTARKLVAQDDLLGGTMAYFRRRLERSALKTPSDVLSQGFQWAKANMLRPLSAYPAGLALTNDPGKSSKIVGRDVAWYVHGCDYVEPKISCELLDVLMRHQRGDGLIPEYVHGITEKPEYWDFNINDNTPLYIVAAHHHWSVTRHRPCLEKLYPSVRKAADLILSSRNEQGLVTCNASGTGVQGICGWRNVLDKEQINGVVTEVNAECYQALCCAAEMCGAMGDTAESARYDAEAKVLRETINDKLVDERTELYVRNIDTNGKVYAQTTVDMVFPLMFHVAEPRVQEAIIARLLSPDFMSSGGLRALPFNNPRWDPSGQAGCLGGVWPGASWWFAMGCSITHNRIMADSLERSYRYVLQDPKTFNTVPGQFNEWSDGQTLVNRGMRLSPWGPPRFLWAGLEGLAGIDIRSEAFTVNPRIPSGWSWIQVEGLPFRGDEVSFFVTRQADGLHLYTSFDIGSELPVHRFKQTNSEAVEPLTGGMTATFLSGPEESMLFFASSRDRLLVGPLQAFEILRDHESYQVFRLTSMDQNWQELGRISRGDLDRIAVRIEPQGYALYKFRP